MKRRTCVIGYTKMLQRMEQRAADATLAGNYEEAQGLREVIRASLRIKRGLHLQRCGKR